jgi:16S rRNA (cytidine1402-2'-O)-methyltransferase
MALYLIATPIGNLKDISERAAEAIESCDLLAVEDTRRSELLLRYLGLNRPLVSFYDAVEEKRVPQLISRLKSGDSVGILSDAGTPLISDPGYRLVRKAIENGVQVIPIPGPSAPIAALIASGMATDRFRFEGFLPRKSSQKRTLLKKILDEPITTLFFESARRLQNTIELLADLCPERAVVIARELTKKHEEFLRGSAKSLLSTVQSHENLKGEITLIVAGNDEQHKISDMKVLELVDALEKENLPPDAIRRLTAQLLSVPKKRVFELMNLKRAD